MQIQMPSTSAAAAAGSVSQTSAKDRAASTGEAPAGTNQSAVEQLNKSEGASADRDAQGGGDGPLARRKGEQAAEAPKQKPYDPFDNLPVASPEPEGGLDLVG